MPFKGQSTQNGSETRERLRNMYGVDFQGPTMYAFFFAGNSRVYVIFINRSSPGKPMHEIRSQRIRLWWTPVLLLAALAGLPSRADAGEITLGTPSEITNSIGMKLVLIPAGEFLMGAKLSTEEVYKKYPGGPKNSSYYKAEHPRHKVRITRRFYMGVHEVTVGDFKKFVAITSYKTAAEKGGSSLGLGKSGAWAEIKGLSWRKPGYPQTDRHPVACVSWHDAKAFCDWLSKKEGKRYRLPSEAQWEHACRAGTSTVFSWGDSADEGKGHLNGAGEEGNPNGQAWNFHFDFDDGYRGTSPTGHYRPNDFGLYDMHGNVSEWCQDWYAPNYYEKSPSDDPTGPTSGRLRVCKSGSWYDGAWFCRAARRLGDAPATHGAALGFRVAVVPSE